MTLNKMLVAQLGAVFAQDPAISLMNYLKNNWTFASGYTPPSLANINFDTKFIKLIDNNVIIFDMGVPLIEDQALGNTRTRNYHKFQIQILCKGNSALNNRYQIEQHIDTLINGNAAAERSDGFDEFGITMFTKIPSKPDSDLTMMKVDTKSGTLARSVATCEVIYDKYQG